MESDKSLWILACILYVKMLVSSPYAIIPFRAQNNFSFTVNVHKMNHSSEILTPSFSRFPLDIPMSIRPMTLGQQSYRYGIVFLGSLINFVVVFVVYYSRQLHYPRHLFWAAISLLNEFTIIQTLLEVVAIVNDDRVACQIFVLHAGVTYTTTLTFMALAALDRYLAIARYEWYKRKVTNRSAIYLLSFGFFVTYTTITSPFWTRFKNISDCTVNITHMHCLMIYDLLLGVVCVILHVMLFLRSRAYINQYPSNFLPTSIALQFLPINPQNDIPGKFIYPSIPYLLIQFHFREEVQQMEGRNHQEENSTNAGQIAEPQTGDTMCFSCFFNRPKINRLEILAALKMVFVLPVWLCTFPVTLNAIMIYWCIRLDENCPVIFQINPYFTDLFLVHIIYNPLMYMSTSTEFKRAVAHLKQKWNF